ncbi:MAG: hypothetical protein ACRDVP_08650 [Acidimicrobiales bacterium]
MGARLSFGERVDSGARRPVFPLGWDRKAIAILVLLPAAAFGLPAAAGYPAISFDNLLQNFPLRVLSGSLIASGHLPLWNPTIWSGSPLLGGLNAGALYPGTLVFAVLPGVLAWVLNLFAVYWTAGLGMYALLRNYRLRPAACLLGALTYQFGGVMTGQLVHLGVIQGIALMPLLVLAELRLAWAVMGTGPIARSSGTSSPWPWVGLEAGVIGLIFLAGEPRGMGEAEIVATIFLVWLALAPYRAKGVPWRTRALFVGLAVLGAGWSVVIGAVQLLPGRGFIVASQRASESYSFFGSGSLRPAMTLGLVLQNVIGGNGSLGQPLFSGNYNLPEVTGYVGLLPLVAFLVLAVRSFTRRGEPGASLWRPWILIGVIGLLAAWGTYTPLGHLFAQIPFYDKLRLQSRNLAIVDLALGIVLAFWADELLGGSVRHRALPRGARVSETVAAVAPPICGLLAAVTMLAAPAVVFVAMGGVGSGAAAIRPWVGAQVVVALGALGVVWAWRRRSGLARRLLAIVTVADLVLFCIGCSTGMFSGGDPAPARAESAAIVGSTGRFAIVGAPDIALLSEASEPDINALTNLDSVQGYGSIVGGSYNDITGTHSISSIDPCALASGVFAPLRLHTVLILASYLSTELSHHASPVRATGCPSAAAREPASRRVLYLGQRLKIASVALIGLRGSHAPAVSLLGASSSVPAQTARRTVQGWSIRFEAAQQATGLVVSAPGARGVSDSSYITTATGARYAFYGDVFGTITSGFQDALDETAWRPDGLWQHYARFSALKLAPVVWAEGGTATVSRISMTRWGSETDAVSAKSATTIVRSEAYLAGWHVVAARVGGHELATLKVFAVGLVQGVRVPKGRWILTFSYWPSGLSIGGVASGVAVLGLLVLFSTLAHKRRRSRRPTS